MGAELQGGCPGTPDLGGQSLFGSRTASGFQIVAHSNECKGGDCPTIYTREGDAAYYIQGSELTPELLAELSIPAGERVVRIPKELLAQLRDQQL